MHCWCCCLRCCLNGTALLQSSQVDLDIKGTENSLRQDFIELEQKAFAWSVNGSNGPANGAVTLQVHHRWQPAHKHNSQTWTSAHAWIARECRDEAAARGGLAFIERESEGWHACFVTPNEPCLNLIIRPSDSVTLSGLEMSML